MQTPGPPLELDDDELLDDELLDDELPPPPAPLDELLELEPDDDELLEVEPDDDELPLDELLELEPVVELLDVELDELDAPPPPPAVVGALSHAIMGAKATATSNGRNLFKRMRVSSLLGIWFRGRP